MITRQSLAVTQVEIARLKLTRGIRAHTKSSHATLLASMQDVGQLSPVGILPPDKEGCLELLFGYGRVACALELGWTHIEAKEFPRETNPGDSLKLAASENSARKSMNFLEQWELIHQYAQLAKVEPQAAGPELGFQQSTVSKLVQCYDRISDSNKKALAEAGVGFTKVYQLSQAEEPLQTELVNRTIKENLTRDQIRDAIKPSKLGLRKFEYQHPQGFLSIAIPKNALVAESISEVLKCFASELRRCLKLTTDPAILAQAIKEQSHVL